MVGVVCRARILNHVLQVEYISKMKAFSNDAGPDTDSEVMVYPRSDGPDFLTCTVGFPYELCSLGVLRATSGCSVPPEDSAENQACRAEGHPA
jgi:hypothetical protein